MTNNAPDYYDNLAFPPQGDWADTNPRANTDRTASTIELVNKIEELNKWLDLKSGYIEKLEKQDEKLSKQIEYMINGFAWIRNENRFVDLGSKNKATVVLTTLAKDGYETAKQAVKKEMDK